MSNCKGHSINKLPDTLHGNVGITDVHNDVTVTSSVWNSRLFLH